MTVVEDKRREAGLGKFLCDFRTLNFPGKPIVTASGTDNHGGSVGLVRFGEEH